MGAMEDMAAKMLKSIIPPDVMALLTPEKLQEAKDQLAAFATFHREAMEHLQAQCQLLIDMVNNQTSTINSMHDNILERLGRIEND